MSFTDRIGEWFSRRWASGQTLTVDGRLEALTPGIYLLAYDDEYISHGALLSALNWLGKRGVDVVAISTSDPQRDLHLLRVQPADVAALKQLILKSEAS